LKITPKSPEMVDLCMGLLRKALFLRLRTSMKDDWDGRRVYEMAF
jgi:hypothetical protein